MKKSIICFILITLCCTLIGCCMSKPAKETEKLIAAIGEVTLDSEMDIIAAEDYYNTLTNDQKNEIKSYKVLVDARKQYDELVRQELANGIIGNWIAISIGAEDNFIPLDEFSERGYNIEGKIMFTDDEYNYKLGDRNEKGTWSIYEQHDDMIIYSFSEEDECHACIYFDNPDCLILTFGEELNWIFARE